MKDLAFKILIMVMILKIDAFPDSPLLYNSLSILVQVPSLFVILAI